MWTDQQAGGRQQDEQMSLAANTKKDENLPHHLHHRSQSPPLHAGQEPASSSQGPKVKLYDPNLLIGVSFHTVHLRKQKMKLSPPLAHITEPRASGGGLIKTEREVEPRPGVAHWER
ncbi:unnamed protein product [Pleuronectes platessa]|uniref:Uncharacterized protein n=1 Tax=Pleuronectes platessa TaxID=8262 RepID=A0A9N7TVN2_PLEPL|nr:unnamed protein product [Pleuronectes platessa]